ncbi:MAG: UDP-N-acetylmuramoyl-L-alanine--D-glutamate ligase [Parcubacteria group bacterium CG08_land_8_20_14_0_20_48_21]|nr:MAG: UDP-N-acetylmuramoylalanine--D-glutamate ligase [Parcubacteria group bacterium CG2_30_48_51]PIS32976.1 MAG: UDP-N-acetylmuramoyl-L-alanine--D-glutamate ligase [Parcubacteria group bacterium CG08_land_8_20_14_0_20_48_21]PIW78911.1 MAG: UDP-N-acetylmuramoyl-L-alanine--D-glutamate ligase [Parcubacteria group bacterium CG_4_8_14_3_um_filter_48_16]PIY77717.1 MAG: UDP-N-acetylmuramoyl-L-alanine--D-glutamate ligase [Parcubacteria group bacterium CG_4_10_14_0_8_um_filter_48_154]PIZ77755.1 MAG: 
MNTAERKNSYRNKQVLIFGLGLYPQGSGMAAALFFLRAGSQVTITDMRPARQLATQRKKLAAKKIAWVLGRHRASDVLRADLIMRNPAVPYDHPLLVLARSRGIPVHNDCSLFFTLAPVRPIGITGTRGKTTTATLVAEILQSHHKEVFLGGNVTVSPLTFARKLTPESKVVLELSSWQLEDLGAWHLSPRVAVVTNIFPDHLNRYAHVRAYARAKEGILKAQQPQDTAILNADNAATLRMGLRAPSRVIWFSQKLLRKGDGVFVRRGNIIVRMQNRERTIMPVEQVRLAGAHNLGNTLAAIAVAAVEGVPQSHIRRVVRRFAGVHSRQEYIGIFRGIRCVNDTTATTPDAALAALATLGDQKKLIMIAGGMDKNLSYAALARALPRACKTVILLPGTATDKLLKHLPKSFQVHTAVSMRNAVDQAFGQARMSDTILLSPGAASFNVFLNEFDRGAQFVQAVRNFR